MKKRYLLLCVLLAGCAGWQKECTQIGAKNFGANWIVVQFDQSGRPFHCWKLRGVSVTSEQGGNVDWQTSDGHLVHLTGWENRVQVRGSDFESAAKLVGVDANLCNNGIYPAR